MKPNIFTLFFFVSLFSFGQSKVGDWEIYLDYSRANNIFLHNNTVYTGTETQFFTYNENDNSISKYSKIDGLSDLNVSAIEYNEEFNVIILGYQNGNIDLFYSFGVINLPYIKDANIIGSKKINNIYVKNNIAYLSCSFGLVELDIENKEIRDTYYFQSNGINSSVFNCVIFDGPYSDKNFLSNKIFVSTSNGVYSTDLNNINIMNTAQWQSDFPVYQNGVKMGDLNTLFENGFENILGNNQEKSLIVKPKDACGFVYFSENDGGFIYKEIMEICDSESSNIIISIDLYENTLMGFSNNILFSFLDVNEIEKTYSNWWISSWNEGGSLESISFKKNKYNDFDIYFADQNRGVVKAVVYSEGGQISSPTTILPNGPVSSGFGDMVMLDNKLIISHGGKNGSWNNLNNTSELSIYHNNYFTNTNALVPNEIQDAISIIPNTNTQNSFFLGTWNSGLLEFENSSMIEVFNEKNSSLQSITKDGWIRIGGGCMDPNNKLWVTNSEANSPISSLGNKSWVSYNSSIISNNMMSGDMFCASNGQKWVQLRNDGLIVFEENDNTLIERKISSSSNNGNLNDNNVQCIQEDNNGNIWVGTDNGINVFYFPNDILTNNNVESDQILVEADGYVEPLLNNTKILDIKVDGGNRKWISTEGKGVFLMSSDGTEQVLNFTKNNSPLLGNTVYGLCIDGESGKVYFATEFGLCSFRAGATQDSNYFNNVLIFPNPVRRNYDGLITISGLTNQTNVKITDVAGNLVYETISEGGTATWDGKSFSGKRVKTGVYLFFCTNSDFTESIVKKLLIYN